MVLTEALVDSGSSINLFHTSYAQLLGIKLNLKKRRAITGIGGIQIDAYPHNLKFMTKGTAWTETEINFSPQQKVNLLGIYGFFDKFKAVSFGVGEGLLEITP